MLRYHLAATQVGAYDSGVYGAGAYGYGEAPAMTFTLTNSTACNGITATLAPAAGTNIAFGTLGLTAVSAAQQFVIDTNAAGYTVLMRSPTGGLARSGGATLTAVPGTHASPAPFPATGEAFGFTLDSTNLTGTGSRFINTPTPGAGLTTANVEVARKTTPSTLGTPLTNCTAFQLRRTSTSPAGAYTASVIYSAVPSF